jgi:hypothetical protein
MQSSQKQQGVLLLVLVAAFSSLAFSGAQVLGLAPDTRQGPVAYVTETPGREWGASGQTTVTFLDALRNNSIQRIMVVEDVSLKDLHQELESGSFEPVQIRRYDVS